MPSPAVRGAKPMPCTIRKTQSSTDSRTVFACLATKLSATTSKRSAGTCSKRPAKARRRRCCSLVPQNSRQRSREGGLYERDLALAQRSPDTLFALLLLWSQALVALSFHRANPTYLLAGEGSRRDTAPAPPIATAGSRSASRPSRTTPRGRACSSCASSCRSLNATILLNFSRMIQPANAVIAGIR